MMAKKRLSFQKKWLACIKVGFRALLTIGLGSLVCTFILGFIIGLFYAPLSDSFFLLNEEVTLIIGAIVIIFVSGFILGRGNSFIYGRDDFFNDDKIKPVKGFLGILRRGFKYLLLLILSSALSGFFMACAILVFLLVLGELGNVSMTIGLSVYCLALLSILGESLLQYRNFIYH